MSGTRLRWRAATVRVVARQLPWRMLLAGCVVAAGAVGLHQAGAGPERGWAVLELLAILLCVAVAFVFEEETSEICDATPVGAEPRRWIRGGIGVAVAAGAWLAVAQVLSVRGFGLLARGCGAMLAVTVATALVAGRRQRSDGGVVAAVAGVAVLVGSAVLARLSPENLARVLELVVAVAVVVALVAGRDPGRRRPGSRRGTNDAVAERSSAARLGEQASDAIEPLEERSR